MRRVRRALQNSVHTAFNIAVPKRVEDIVILTKVEDIATSPSELPIVSEVGVLLVPDSCIAEWLDADNCCPELGLSD